MITTKIMSLALITMLSTAAFAQKAKVDKEVDIRDQHRTEAELSTKKNVEISADVRKVLMAEGAKNAAFLKLLDPANKVVTANLNLNTIKALANAKKANQERVVDVLASYNLKDAEAVKVASAEISLSAHASDSMELIDAKESAAAFAEYQKQGLGDTYTALMWSLASVVKTAREHNESIDMVNAMVKAIVSVQDGIPGSAVDLAKIGADRLAKLTEDAKQIISGKCAVLKGKV